MKAAAPAYLTRLREATRSIHSELEGLTDSHRILGGDLDRGHFERLLGAHLQLHRQVGALVAQVQSREAGWALLDWPDCARLAALEADAERMGMDAPEGAPLLEESPSPAFVVGVTYVAEGSCMGNQRVLAAVADHPDYQAWGGSAFLTSCRDMTPQRFRALLEAMEPQAAASYRELERGALAGFRCFRSSWLAADAGSAAGSPTGK